MSATPITTIPNRPANQPVFDYQIPAGYVRVVLATVSNDGQQLIMSGWAFQITQDGTPVLDPKTAAPVATADGTRTVALSGVLAGTHTLYDGWVKYTPPSGTTINANALPEGWTSGTGAPTGTPAYGSGYYDTAADQGWIYSQGCLDLAASSFAEALQVQLDTAAKLSGLGLTIN